MSTQKTAIVIGTGAGGLTASAYLAQGGFKVKAFEQARQIGGYLNPFVRKKFHFDPGVHYVGEGQPGQLLYRIINGLGLNFSALFCEMDPQGFDRFRFPDFEISMCRGLEEYQERLIRAFPKDGKDIDRFFALMRSIKEGNDALMGIAVRGPRVSDVKGILKSTTMLRWLKATYADMLDAIISNPRLKSVLAAQCGDLGLPPSQSSALYSVGLILHYSTGAFFPRGGSGALRDALVEKAREYGADYFTGQSVKRILLDGKTATGIELENGERVMADVIISGAEPQVTFEKLIGKENLSYRLRRKVSRVKPSYGTFCVFLGLNRDLRQYGLGNSNVWNYASWDLEEPYRAVKKGMMPLEPSFFLSPNSLKDDSGKMAPGNCSTLEIVTIAPYEPFAQWDGMASYKRGPAYENLKNRIGDQILEGVERRWPGLIGDVVVKEMGTPVTNSYFVNAVRGGAYGLAMLPDQVGPFRFQPKTAYKNLYLAGSGVFGGGVAPSMMSGMVSAYIAGAKKPKR